MRINFIAAAGDVGARLDKALAAHFAAAGAPLARAALRRLVEGGYAEIDGAVCRRCVRTLREGEQVACVADIAAASENAAEKNTAAPSTSPPFTAAYEDDEVLIADKAAGVVAHPGAKNAAGTLQDAVLEYLPQNRRLPRGGLAHRLDKDTSGLLAIAKNARALKLLLAQFKSRGISREYLAIVHGAPPQTGVVQRSLARSRAERVKMAVRHDGREAVTHFAVEARFAGFALLRCWLRTGRTHQIRAHMEHAGFPIVGDALYRRRAAAAKDLIARQALHAHTLKFSHPDDDRAVRVVAPPPADFQRALKILAAKK